MNKRLMTGFIFLLLTVMVTGCGNIEKSSTKDGFSKINYAETQVAQESQDVVLGNEQFDEYLPLLSDKRVALFSNQTGIVGDDEHILDALIERFQRNRGCRCEHRKFR